MRKMTAVALWVFTLVACGPATLSYTVRIESEPSGAKIYDPKTDELIGQTPFELPVMYNRRGALYERVQTAFDHYNPQDPMSGGPHQVALDTGDYVKLYLVAEGFEKVEQQVDWMVTPVDGQVIKKIIRLRPLKAAEDDVR